jgi:Aspartyl/Asparaginyl beta-hydroxylase
LTKFDGHVRDLGEIPAELLAKVVNTVAANAELWQQNDPRFSTAHPGSRHMIFRFPDSYPQSHLSASYTPLWDIWAGCLTPIIELVGERYGFAEYGTAKIMLSSLAAHSEVPAHIDSNPSSLVPHKVHVPLITTPDVVFVVDGVCHHMCVGRAYELNNLLVHSVENAGDVDRVHLIFDIYATRTGGDGTR